MAAVSQPLFGLIADRWGTRFTGLALIWTAAGFAAVGFAPSYPALLAIAFVSGAGSGAFHPFGALTVRGLLPSRAMSTGMSVYVTGGTVGVAAGPMVDERADDSHDAHRQGQVVAAGLPPCGCEQSNNPHSGAFFKRQP